MRVCHTESITLPHISIHTVDILSVNCHSRILHRAEKAISVAHKSQQLVTDKNWRHIKALGNIMTSGVAIEDDFTPGHTTHALKRSCTTVESHCSQLHNTQTAIGPGHGSARLSTVKSWVFKEYCKSR